MSVASRAERRRSLRLPLIVPLVIRGESSDKKPFQEETVTLSVNAHGALVVLATNVALGQTLVLMNPQNWDERDGRVARIGLTASGLIQVGVEFARPAPEFWPVGAPPKRVCLD